MSSSDQDLESLSSLSEDLQRIRKLMKHYRQPLVVSTALKQLQKDTSPIREMVKNIELSQSQFRKSIESSGLRQLQKSLREQNDGILSLVEQSKKTQQGQLESIRSFLNEFQGVRDLIQSATKSREFLEDIENSIGTRGVDVEGLVESELRKLFNLDIVGTMSARESTALDGMLGFITISPGGDKDSKLLTKAQLVVRDELIQLIRAILFFLVFTTIEQNYLPAPVTQVELQKLLEQSEANTIREFKEIVVNLNEEQRTVAKTLRIVTASALHIRDLPRRSGASYGLLPNGSVIIVVDNSYRSWLLVEAKVNGETILGWVNRGYTRKISIR